MNNGVLRVRLRSEYIIWETTNALNPKPYTLNPIKPKPPTP